MTQTITISAVDGEPPLDSEFLEELEESLRELDEEHELDLGLELRDRPPVLGQQGSIPVALEVIVASSTVVQLFAGSLAGALAAKLRKHQVTKIKIELGDRKGEGKSVEIVAQDFTELEDLKGFISTLLDEARKGGRG
jgi:hypothetical protein